MATVTVCGLRLAAWGDKALRLAPACYECGDDRPRFERDVPVYTLAAFGVLLERNDPETFRCDDCRRRESEHHADEARLNEELQAHEESLPPLDDEGTL